MFNLSVKGKYGLLAVIELERYQQEGPIQIKSIAEAKKIPQHYLEQILLSLKRAGLVNSFRGSQGGYILAKSAEAITVMDVLKILEGPIQLCQGMDCNSGIGVFWKSIEKTLTDKLSITIGDVIRQKIALENIATYSI